VKKLGILVLCLVLALGVIGVGYAAWSTSLSIQGNVATGTLSATIGPNGAPTSSQAYATINTTGSTSTNLVVNIANAAPGNVFTVYWIVTNTGTIPANITLAAPVVAVVSGAGATVADLSVSASPAPIALNPTSTTSGTYTITVNNSAPNIAGGCSYTVNVAITASQP
jgi:hypothetical protein